jgi:GntR family transcriptional regulator
MVTSIAKDLEDCMVEGEHAAKLLRIEQSGVPIYVQIRDQVMHLIGTGVFAPGQQMPTMRQVAVALRVDLNTVRHAYDELARAGVINVVRARGTYVAEKRRSSSMSSNTKAIDDVARRCIELATVAGVEPRVVARRMVHMVRSRGASR